MSKNIILKQWYRFETDEDRKDFINKAKKTYKDLYRALAIKPKIYEAECLQINISDSLNYDYTINYRSKYNSEYMHDCALYKTNKNDKKESIKNMIDASVDVGYGRMSEDTIVNNYYNKASKRITDDIVKRRKCLIENTNCYKLINAYIKDMNILFNRQGRKEHYLFGQDIEAICAYEVKNALTL